MNISGLDSSRPSYVAEDGVVPCQKSGPRFLGSVMYTAVPLDHLEFTQTELTSHKVTN